MELTDLKIYCLEPAHAEEWPNATHEPLELLKKLTEGENGFEALSEAGITALRGEQPPQSKILFTKTGKIRIHIGEHHGNLWGVDALSVGGSGKMPPPEFDEAYRIKPLGVSMETSPFKVTQTSVFF